MKGLIVNSDKNFVLKDNLTRPIAEQEEVLVRVKSASVNPFDAESAQGRFDAYFSEYQVSKEVQSGLEFSGIVESDGQKFKRGDRVFGYVNMITGWKSHAQYIAINENQMALMPSNLSFPQAASIPLGSLTTLIALQDIGQLNTGMKLLLNGAAGGLGIQGIQIAKLLGAHVTAIAGKSQTEFLQSYGADVVYDYNQISMNDINDTFDVILDLTNTQNLQEMKKRLTVNGIFIPGEPNQKNGGESEDPQVGYLMVMQGDFAKLTRIADWISQGKLKPVIDKEYDFSNYLQAFSRLREKGRRGRIVLNW
ncbi:MAG: NADPH:quinone reductase-like Zn-dependent oxidoreductase [Oceanospirillaceae bacterium]|jgi:NADPH:quinone reductase-like Zn-dependent oxidoreductase